MGYDSTTKGYNGKLCFNEWLIHFYKPNDYNSHALCARRLGNLENSALSCLSCDFCVAMVNLFDANVTSTFAYLSSDDLLMF